MAIKSVASVVVPTVTVFAFYAKFRHKRSELKYSTDVANRTIQPWNNNWDSSAGQESHATRNLYLIRHGQYVLDANTREEKILTRLGREQAAVTGQYLANSNIPFTSLTVSTLVRAQETASIISEQLPAPLPRTEDSLLAEGFPFPPEPTFASYKVPLKEKAEQSVRIESAFKKYFHRAPSSQKSTSHEVIVCHANVIRYFVCRALQLPPEAWLRISLANASITHVRIRPNGRVGITTLGNIGFMPFNKQTFT